MAHCESLAWNQYFTMAYILFCRQNQVVLLDTLEQEISKFRECNSILDINALVSFTEPLSKCMWGCRNILK